MICVAIFNAVFARLHIKGFLETSLRGFPYAYVFKLVEQFISFIFVLGLHFQFIQSDVKTYDLKTPVSGADPEMVDG